VGRSTNLCTILLKPSIIRIGSGIALKLMKGPNSPQHLKKKTIYVSRQNILLEKAGYSSVFRTEIEMDVPQSRINTTEDQTTFTTDTNTEMGHFLFCATSRTAPYHIPWAIF
jgi:hypothetical protein